MKKWKIVKKEKPPINRQFWGYNVFDMTVHVCEWDGIEKNDYNEPSPRCVDRGGDDYSIEFWMEMEGPPHPPKCRYGLLTGNQFDETIL